MGVALGLPAQAKPRVVVQKTYYDIAGKTGTELLRSMDRKGPRHGFFGHAIAQTRYEIGWSSEMVRKDGVCRLRNADVRLSVNYIYPRVPETARGALRSRWKAFMSEVIRHEEEHGRLAIAMAKDTERMLKAYRPAKGSCVTAESDLRKRFRAIYSSYEERQVAFDTAEHKQGGRVDAMIRTLVGR